MQDQKAAVQTRQRASGLEIAARVYFGLATVGLSEFVLSWYRRRKAKAAPSSSEEGRVMGASPMPVIEPNRDVRARAGLHGWRKAAVWVTVIVGGAAACGGIATALGITHPDPTTLGAAVASAFPDLPVPATAKLDPTTVGTPSPADLADRTGDVWAEYKVPSNFTVGQVDQWYIGQNIGGVDLPNWPWCEAQKGNPGSGMDWIWEDPAGHLMNIYTVANTGTGPDATDVYIQMRRDLSPGDVDHTPCSHNEVGPDGTGIGGQ